MKKMMCFAAALALCAAAASADWAKIVAVGVDVPIARDRIDWTDASATMKYNGVKVFSGSSDVSDMKTVGFDGVGVNGLVQARFVSDSGLSFLAGFDVGYLSDVGDSDLSGVNWSGLFGAGYNFSKSDDWRAILSGVVGIDGCALSGTDDLSGVSVDLDVAQVDFVFGADFFFSKQISGSFGVFAEATATFGVGKATAEGSWSHEGMSISTTLDGDSRIFTFKPKLGVCWTF